MMIIFVLLDVANGVGPVWDLNGNFYAGLESIQK